MPQYAPDSPTPRQHPMVEDAMDTAKGTEMDLNNIEQNWRERRESLIQSRDAHLACADLLKAAINRVDYFLREDTGVEAKMSSYSEEPMTTIRR